LTRRTAYPDCSFAATFRPAAPAPCAPAAAGAALAPLARPRRPRPTVADGPVTAALVLLVECASGPTRYTVRALSRSPGDEALMVYLLRRIGAGPDHEGYHVCQHLDGPTCDCPDYQFRRDGLDPSGCKHVRALIQVGLLWITYDPQPQIGG
jgi:hypothetical protein